LAHHVSKARFGELVEAALAELPAQFAEHLEEVPIEVRDRPTARQLKALRPGRGNLLLGLYDGLPLSARSVEHSGVRPPVIYLFQESIEQVSQTERDLVEQVRTTVLHEIGHHFGMSEADLDELGYG
jgi:predicted Zn-dependent protease with MMP-like domain